MFLACPACDTNYKLDDLALGPSGRKVRCVNCGNVWRAVPPAVEDEVLPYEQVDPFKTTDAIAEQDMSLSFTADAPFTQDYDPSFDMPPSEDGIGQPSYDRPPIPEGLVSGHAAEPLHSHHHDDVAAYMPMGMSANLLGACVFLLPFLITVGLLVALRAPLSHSFPALTPIYNTIGLTVELPGGGLRLSTLVAERKIERDKKTLSMSAQLSNVSPTAQPYPALKATAYGPYGALIKSWDLPAPADGRTLASGEDAPIRAEFKDVPDAAAKLELRVTRP